MAERRSNECPERRAGYCDLIEVVKEVRDEIKDLKTDIKTDISALEQKINDQVSTNNKFYFNGFEPHKHVADHHIIDSVVEKMQDNKKTMRSITEKWVDRIAFAIITYIAAATWFSFKEDVKAPQTPTTQERKADVKPIAEHP